jgi:hypothetical protein
MESQKIHGYHGKILRISLSHRTFNSEPLSREDLPFWLEEPSGLYSYHKDCWPEPMFWGGDAEKTLAFMQPERGGPGLEITCNCMSLIGMADLHPTDP